MDVTAIEDSERSVDITVRPSLEDMPAHPALPYETLLALVGSQYRIKMLKRSWASNPRPSEYHGATKFFVSETHEVPLGMDMPPYGMKGEDAENDRAWRKYNRLEVARDHTVAAMALPIVTALTRGAFGELVLSFGRKVGCSCGCSPGFRLRSGNEGVNLRFAGQPVDIYVTRIPSDAEMAARRERLRVVKEESERMSRAATLANAFD